jgi:hypothetical protein
MPKTVVGSRASPMDFPMDLEQATGFPLNRAAVIPGAGPSCNH